MPVLAQDDFELGMFVTVEQAFYLDPETSRYLPCGLGTAWVGPGYDFRGDLFRVVHFDRPLLVLEWLCDTMGNRAAPPRRIAMDTRYVSFRRLSVECARAMLSSSAVAGPPAEMCQQIQALLTKAFDASGVKMVQMGVPPAAEPSPPKRTRRLRKDG